MFTHTWRPRVLGVTIALGLVLTTSVGASPLGTPGSGGTAPAAGLIEPTMTYQGQLTDASGDPGQHRSGHGDRYDRAHIHPHDGAGHRHRDGRGESVAHADARDRADRDADAHFRVRHTDGGAGVAHLSTLVWPVSTDRRDLTSTTNDERQWCAFTGPRLAFE